MQETWVQSLGWEDHLEKRMAILPVFLPGESHGQRGLVGYSLWACKELDTTERHFHTPSDIRLLGFKSQLSLASSFVTLGMLWLCASVSIPAKWEE